LIAATNTTGIRTIRPIVFDFEQAEMPSFSIAGVPVDFPKEPYDVQTKFMSCAINALKSGQNALLESPTGTGKTLCLLCATLAWQQQELKDRRFKDEGQAGAGTGSGGGLGSSLAYSDGPNITAEQQRLAIQSSLNFDNPTGQMGNALSADTVQGSATIKTRPTVIIYASRTHTQLKQVVRELRSTNYNPEMTVLGSRDQLCINRRVADKYKGTQLVHACNRATSAHACKFKNNLDTVTSKSQNGQRGGGRSSWLDGLTKALRIMDIEELAKRGRSEDVCPYFHTRSASEDARLLLMPYNYLLEASIRKTLNVNWEGAVVIFDEAHNLEKVACDAVSVSLSSADIGACIAELKQTLRELANQDAASGSLAGNGSGPDGKSFTLDSRRPEKAYVAQLLTRTFELERRLDAVSLSASNPGPTASAVMPGTWMDKTLKEVGFVPRLKESEVENIKMIIEFLMMLAHENPIGAVGSGSGHGHGHGAATSTSSPKLEKLMRLIEKSLADPGNSNGHGEDYKVFIAREEEEGSKRYGGYQSYQNSSNQSPGKNNKWVLNYWGFSPGIALQELKAVGVRQILLASGTLSPMAAFRADLKLPFPVELQNPHVISLPKQVWVGAIGVGPTGKQLSSTYEIRETDQYKDELGASLLLILQTMLGRGGAGGVPGGPRLDGGVLVFFVSYRVMSDVEARWKKTGVWQSLVNIGGSIIVEPSAASEGKGKTTGGDESNKRKSSAPRGKSISPPPRKTGGFDVHYASNTEGNASIGDDDDDDEIKNFMQQFETSVSNNGRCILLAVCRGKASEGIDFSDSKGRVAVMTGIPYAPPHDAWVTLKRQYMDENSVIATKAPPPAMTVSTSQAVGGWAVAVQNASTSSSSNIPGAGYIVPPPAPFAAKVTAIGASGNKLNNKMPTLSGQQWYQQSACRAVNQALGRIIRHKTDWGAIFLLDHRFNQSSQKAELSHWIRPVHKSYSDFKQSLVSFRAFATAAMQNPDLVPSVPEPVGNAVPVDRVIDSDYLVQLNRRLNPRYHSEEIGVLGNTLYLNESDIPHEPGTSYINPALLANASHTRPAAKSIATSSAGVLKDTLDSDAFSQAPTKSVVKVATAPSAPERPNIFSKAAKTKETAPDDLAHLKKKTAGASSAGLVRKDLFGTSAATQSTSSFGLGSSSSSQSASKRSGGIALGGFSGAIQLVSKSQQASVKLESGSEFVSAAAAGDASNEDLSKEDKKLAMTEAVEGIQSALSKHAFISLLELIREAKKSKLGKEKEVENFINAVLGLMLEQTQLSSGEIQYFLLDLRHLISVPDMLQLYTSSVRAKCSADKSRSTGAKRLRPTTLADLSKLTMPLTATIAPEKRSKYLCPICKDMALEPCVAKCGHVCCKHCWGKWLRVNPVCPQCKESADPRTITPIVMLRG